MYCFECPREYAWSDPAGVGVDPRSAPGLCRVVAGDDCPVRSPVPPGGGAVRPPESRGPASGREQAARSALEPGGIRALALSRQATRVHHRPKSRLLGCMGGPILLFLCFCKWVALALTPSTSLPQRPKFIVQKWVALNVTASLISSPSRWPKSAG